MTVIVRNPASIAAFNAKKLAKERLEAVAKVNAACAAIRQKYITVIPGQDMIYLAKETEARSYLMLPTEPETLMDFPFMAKEVGITAPSAYELAQLWANMAAIWRVVAAAIEEIRLGTIATIETAPDSATIETALATMNQIIEGAQL